MRQNTAKESHFYYFHCRVYFLEICKLLHTEAILERSLFDLQERSNGWAKIKNPSHGPEFFGSEMANISLTGWVTMQIWI